LRRRHWQPAVRTVRCCWGLRGGRRPASVIAESVVGRPELGAAATVEPAAGPGLGAPATGLPEPAACCHDSSLARPGAPAGRSGAAGAARGAAAVPPVDVANTGGGRDADAGRGPSAPPDQPAVAGGPPRTVRQFSHRAVPAAVRHRPGAVRRLGVPAAPPAGPATPGERQLRRHQSAGPGQRPHCQGDRRRHRPERRHQLQHAEQRQGGRSHPGICAAVPLPASPGA
uniref:Mobile element protein n=1 Tax=Macrostomum lignano TaxID=282301 RepID=A0A1I8I4K1_9PLAT